MLSQYKMKSPYLTRPCPAPAPQTVCPAPANLLPRPHTPFLFHGCLGLCDTQLNTPPLIYLL